MTQQEKLEQFIQNLKGNNDVLAAILFGSYARGNSRPESDIDLVVILNDGYRRTVEYLEEQAFEIIYITEKGALDYWNSNKHDAVGLWSVAKVLFDRNGAGERLRKVGDEILREKPPIFDSSKLDHLRFDASDSIKAIESMQISDTATASLLLCKKATDFINLYFERKQMWRPAPKQQMEIISKIDGEMGGLFQSFYNSSDIKERIALIKVLATRILE